MPSYTSQHGNAKLYLVKLRISGTWIFIPQFGHLAWAQSKNPLCTEPFGKARFPELLRLFSYQIANRSLALRSCQADSQPRWWSRYALLGVHLTSIAFLFHFSYHHLDEAFGACVHFACKPRGFQWLTELAQEISALACSIGSDVQGLYSRSIDALYNCTI